MDTIVAYCQHDKPVAFCLIRSSDGFKEDMCIAYRLVLQRSEESHIVGCAECAKRIARNYEICGLTQ